LVTWVVEPVDEVHPKSLKVELVIEARPIFSEKVAATLVSRPMPVPVGIAALTLGFVGPPLSARAPSVGSVSERELLAVPQPQLVPESRLWPPSVVVPPTQFPPEGLLAALATIMFLRVALIVDPVAVAVRGAIAGEGGVGNRKRYAVVDPTADYRVKSVLDREPFNDGVRPGFDIKTPAPDCCRLP
jgi:hypothetical protein